jgi:hypothetical protein
MREKLNDAVDAARPYAERIARDEKLHEHVKNAYESARSIYDELIGDRGATGTALRVARDKDLQDELKRTIQELRKAGERVQKADSHTGRNMTLLLAGIVLGVLFNPVTGAETRRWIRDALFGEESPFEHSSNGS